MAIFPFGTALGVDEGFVPGPADFLGKQLAATGASQRRTIKMMKVGIEFKQLSSLPAFHN